MPDFDLDETYKEGRHATDAALRRRKYGIPLPEEEALQPGFPSDVLDKGVEKGVQALGQAGAAVRENVVEPAGKVLTGTLGLTLPEGMPEKLAGEISGLPTAEQAAKSPGTAAVMTGLGALPFLGTLRRFKPSISPEEFAAMVEKQVAPTPSVIAEKVREALAGAEKTVPDEVIRAKAAQLVASGGVSLETVQRLHEGELLTVPQTYALAKMYTELYGNWAQNIAKPALASNNPALQEEALVGFKSFVESSYGRFEEVRSETARAQRIVGILGSDVAKLRTATANVMNLPESATPAQHLEALIRPWEETQAFIAKHVSKPYRKLYEQAQGALASGDEQAIRKALTDLMQASGVPADEKAVIQEVMGQLDLPGVPTKPPAPAGQGEFGLTSELPGPARPQQQSLLDKPAAIPAGTVEMVVRQINERLAKKKGFSLTGGLGKGRGPTQLDLDLFPRIIQEPPEQLALDLARGDVYSSREYLRLISQIRRDLAVGTDAQVAATYNKLRQRLGLGEPKPPAPLKEPTRLMADEIKALQQFFAKGSGGLQLTPRQMLEALTADPNLTPERLAALIANAKQGGWGDVIQWLLVNNMLSPASDLVNLTATTFTFGWNTLIRGAAGQLGRLTAPLTGQAGVARGEMSEMLYGAYASFWDAVQAANKALRTGESTFRADRLELRRLNPMTGTNVARLLGSTASGPVLEATGPFGRAIDFFGHTFGVTGRLMLAGDEFVKAMAVSAEAHALAYRTAYNTALKNNLSYKEFKDLYTLTREDLRRTLPSSFRQDAEQFALYTTLNQDLGKIGQTFLSVREALNKYGGGFAGTAVMPFFRTLANSAKQTGENTPLAIFSRAVREDMFGTDPVKRDLALAKWSVGTLFMSTMYALARSGKITDGGPSDLQLRRQMEATGWKPYSYVTDDGKYLPLPEWLGIPGNLIKMAADVAMIHDYVDDTTRERYAGTLIGAFVGNLTFDFLRDTSNIFAAFAHGLRRE